MKLSARHTHLLFSLITSMIVACIVTFVLTVVNHGFQNFFMSWERSFVVAWMAAFPSVLLIAPRVRKLVQRLTAQ